MRIEHLLSALKRMMVSNSLSCWHCMPMHCPPILTDIQVGFTVDFLNITENMDSANIEILKQGQTKFMLQFNLSLYFNTSGT